MTVPRARVLLEDETHLAVGFDPVEPDGSRRRVYTDDAYRRAVLDDLVSLLADLRDVDPTDTLALGGLAGALAAMYFQVLVFTMFAPRVTFIALLIMFLGGVGNNRAMIVGAFLFWAFQTATTELAGFVATDLRTNFQAFRFVLMGLLFLLILYYRPQGLMGERSGAEVSEQ